MSVIAGTSSSFGRKMPVLPAWRQCSCCCRYARLLFLYCSCIVSGGTTATIVLCQTKKTAVQCVLVVITSKATLFSTIRLFAISVVFSPKRITTNYYGFRTFNSPCSPQIIARFSRSLVFFCSHAVTSILHRKFLPVVVAYYAAVYEYLLMPIFIFAQIYNIFKI